MNWRNPPPTVVPPGIRRAGWTPPMIGTYFTCTRDQSVWRVSAVFRRDQQVKLASDTGCEPVYVFAAELLRDYRQVA